MGIFPIFYLSAIHLFYTGLLVWMLSLMIFYSLSIQSWCSSHPCCVIPYLILWMVNKSSATMNYDDVFTLWVVFLFTKGLALTHVGYFYLDIMTLNCSWPKRAVFLPSVCFNFHQLIFIHKLYVKININRKQ